MTANYYMSFIEYGDNFAVGIGIGSDSPGRPKMIYDPHKIYWRGEVPMGTTGPFNEYELMERIFKKFK